MKKIVTFFAALFLLVLPSEVFASAPHIPSEYYQEAKVIMPNNLPLSSSAVRFKDGRMYLFIAGFNGFLDVYATNDLGGGAKWDPEKGDIPGKKTSVAELRQVSDGKQKVLIVVNKATGEVFVQTEAEGASELDAIVEDGKVYLPLRATSELLGGRVDYDASHDLAVVTQSFKKRSGQ